MRSTYYAEDGIFLCVGLSGAVFKSIVEYCLGEIEQRGNKEFLNSVRSITITRAGGGKEKGRRGWNTIFSEWRGHCASTKRGASLFHGQLPASMEKAAFSLFIRHCRSIQMVKQRTIKTRKVSSPYILKFLWGELEKGDAEIVLSPARHR